MGEGVLVSQIKMQSAGQHLEQIDVAGIAEGTYLIKLFINNQALISKIIILR